MYLADEAVALGSSNFSHGGFTTMLEANVRFTGRETARAREVRQTAENFWDMARPFDDGLLRLLAQLLRATSFEEAVARACAALLDGDWAIDLLRELEQAEHIRLWPSQREGIARALWILERQGSALIADATGAGKTRMGCSLLAALQQRLWRRGRVHGGMFLMVAPRGVMPHWERERSLAGLNLQIYSDGVVSSARAGQHEHVLRDLKRAQCLAVDEAHHFLNRSSQRTRHMLGNLADHVLLFTATPINRGVRDILALVDLLGADNLDDETLRFFDALSQRLRRLGSAFALTPEERERLQRMLGHFVLRRTKRDLKAAIEAEPEAYRDDRGQPCRYPEHMSHTYGLNESSEDRKLAKEIRDLAGRLKGLIQFQGEIRKSAFHHRDEARYVEGRLRIANALAVYRVMAALRSSRAALVEHLRGTTEACRRFDIAPGFKSDDTGNEIERLRGLAGRVPSCDFPEALPEWLREPEAHARTVEEGIAILEAIEAKIMAMSGAREQARLELLLALRREHAHVLAFDSRLISLAWMRDRLQAAGPDAEILLASGDSDSDRGRIERYFAPGATRPAIALCSDAVSEGVNLQQASAVVLLDLPSVIRVAEQRIGRIDRLNSPHPRVHIHWPDDAPEFALKSDRKFVQRHLDVGALLGANIEVTDELMGEALAGEDVPDSARDMMRAVERGEVERFDGLMDALAPARGLVEGENAIVPPEVWREMRRLAGDAANNASHCLIALVDAPEPWSFFAVSGIRPDDGGRGWAPQWVWFDESTPEPVTDIGEIAARLRRAWQSGAREVDASASIARAETLFERAARRLNAAEECLLPRRRRRALAQMREVLAAWRKRGGDTGRWAGRLLDAMRPDTGGNDESVNRHALADAWLEATADAWLELMQKRRRNAPLRLKDVTPELKARPMTPDELERLWNRIETVPAASARAMVCIIAAPMRGLEEERQG